LDVVAAEYDRSYPHIPDRYFELLCAELGISQGSVVVDLGCGSGRLALALARKGAAVTGVDCSDTGLAIAHRSDTGHLVTWVHGLAEDFWPASLPVDAAVAFEAFHLFTNARKVIANAAQYIRPAGSLAVGWCEYHWETALRATIVGVFTRYGISFSDWGYWTCPGFAELVQGASRFFTETRLSSCRLEEATPIEDIARFLVSIDRTAGLTPRFRSRLFEELVGSLGSAPQEWLSGTTNYCVSVTRRKRHEQETAQTGVTARACSATGPHADLVPGDGQT
jgi:SAM-dependent methyltransferase